MKDKKVVLGLSGGVDSTAAALLLQEQGYEVTALYFDVFGKGEETAAGAKRAAERLGIPLLYKDISKAFKRKVIAYFYNEYVAGRTPNPCVMCNKEIKYSVLLQAAAELGAARVATGHYARVKKRDEDGLYTVRIAANAKKDQSYVLWKLGQEELSRVIFPLGEMESKEQIREILRKKGFENAEKKDSQEICFVKNDDYITFLKQKMGLKTIPGDFLDREGRILGPHQGIIHYTIGQRKGLGITFGKPMFVTKIDGTNNTVVLGSNEDLFSKKVKASRYHFCGPVPKNGTEALGKIRYASDFAPCHIHFTEEQDVEGKKQLIVEFDQPQRAPTPGQSLVLYREDELLGGGIIEL